MGAQVVELAHPPARVARLEIFVEREVRGRRLPADQERGEIGDSEAEPAPDSSAGQVVGGLMWIMLAQNIASKLSGATSQSSSTFSGLGAATLVSPSRAIQAAID